MTHNLKVSIFNKIIPIEGKKSIIFYKAGKLPARVHSFSSFSISLYGNEVSIAFDPEKQWICLTRKHWVSGQPEYRYCSLRSLSDVEIWSDSSSLEIFLNRGEAVLSSRICPESDDPGIRMSGSMNESDIKIYELNHIEGEVYE